MTETYSYQRFQALLSHLADGGLNADEMQELGAFVLVNDLFRREYLEYCQMHGLLRAEHGLLTAYTDSA